LKKKGFVILAAGALVVLLSSTVLAQSDNRINFLTDENISKEELQKSYEEIYRTTPFIIDPDTGERLKNPVTGEF
jgi:hypothetical protein